MSYEPTVWKTGDVVTSSKLNKLENAVAQSGVGNLVVHVNDSEDDEYYYATFDKTFRDVYDAMVQGWTVRIIHAALNSIELKEIVVGLPLVSEDLPQGDSKLTKKGIADEPITSNFWIKTFDIVNRSLYVYDTDNADGYPVSRIAKE